MKKKIFWLLGLAVILIISTLTLTYTIRTVKYTPKDGDIIFQSSQSFQSTAIKIGTVSKYSHCGIIVMRNDRPYVLEAHKGVELTPLNKWIDRGVLCNHYKIMRLKDAKKLKINYTLNVPYDLDFRFNNGKYYCSELVWDIYKDNNIDLCNPKQLKEYHFLNVPLVKKKIKERGFTLEQSVVAPSDLVKSNKLKTVAYGFL
jgi:uncharacterized protein YycO